jgi:hypothetical protein
MKISTLNNIRVLFTVIIFTSLLCSIIGLFSDKKTLILIGVLFFLFAVTLVLVSATVAAARQIPRLKISDTTADEPKLLTGFRFFEIVAYILFLK